MPEGCCKLPRARGRKDCQRHRRDATLIYPAACCWRVSPGILTLELETGSNLQLRYVTDGPAVKSTGCSSRGPQVPFPASTQQLTIICNYSSRRPGTLHQVCPATLVLVDSSRIVKLTTKISHHMDCYLEV